MTELHDEILRIVYKHLPGQHDQKTHGRRGGGKNQDSDNSSKYSERASELYKSIPKEVRDLVPAPEINDDKNIGDAHFMFGRININPDEYAPRVESKFYHEFGHYFDYKTDITNSDKFTKAFDAVKERATGIEELLYPSKGSYFQKRDWENIGSMVSALSGGKRGWGTAQWTPGYFSVSGRDKKEAFAIAFESNVAYSPRFFKLFPEMREFFNG